jgi:O-glycosyl hydrolase
MRIDGITFANSAFVSPTRDTFAIIALNATVNGRPATYDFGGFNVSDVKAYRTSKELDLAEVERPATEVHRFSATLAPFSVTTFVGKLKPAID